MLGGWVLGIWAEGLSGSYKFQNFGLIEFRPLGTDEPSKNLLGLKSDRITQFKGFELRVVAHFLPKV
jgi:hypothetical protein